MLLTISLRRFGDSRCLVRNTTDLERSIRDALDVIAAFHLMRPDFYWRPLPYWTSATAVGVPTPGGYRSFSPGFSDVRDTGGPFALVGLLSLRIADGL